MKRFFTLLLSLMILPAFAQLPDTNFPDFSFTDLDGNVHNLQTYHDQGKVVFIDVFATWCPNCTANIDEVRTIWQERGPQGDDSIVVLYMERDPNTTNEASWVNTHNIQIPVIAEAEQFIADLGITYQPVHIIICPDKTYDTHLGSAGDGSPITDLIDQCETTITGIEEDLEESKVSWKTGEGQIMVTVVSDTPRELTLYNLMGREVAQARSLPGSTIWQKDGLMTGIYILRVGDESVKIVIP